MNAHAQKNKQLKRLDEKIATAHKKGDYLSEIKLKQERERLLQLSIVKERTTLLDCIRDRSPEERREATTRVIYAIATADLLYGATMEVEEYLRKEFGIVDIPIMDHMRGIVEQLRKIVKSIDDVGSEMFSEHYAEVVDEIETKYEATMKNYILNRLLKASKAQEGDKI